jgi:hypothetical protein
MVSFVMFTLIPKISDIVQSFMAGKPFAYGTAIGEAFGPVKGGALLGLGVAGSKQETAAKTNETSPYLYGSTKDRAVYTLNQALRALLSQR